MPRLNIDTDGKVQLNSEDLIGVSAAILGITGSGKSNTAAVLIEEGLANGLPMTIIDTDGEHWGLKEKFEILVAGRGEHVDVEIGPLQAARLAELSVRQRLPVILDIGEMSLDEQFEMVKAYLDKLWEVCSILREPYQVVVEEAHEFVPQGGRTPVKDILIRIFKRGRKRGLSCVLVSQRSQKVDKEVLTQARLFFLHRVIHPVDLRVYQDLIPLPAKQVDQIAGDLKSGQAGVLWNNRLTIAYIRLRSTFHAGATPTMNGAPLPKLREIDKAILDGLRSAVSEETKPEAAQPDPAGAARIQELERQVAALRTENQRLCDELKARPPEVTRADEAVIRLAPDDKPLDDAKDKPYRSTRRQREVFEFLIADLLKMSIRHRKMLRFLVEREPQVFSLRDIARRLDYSETSLQTRWIDLFQTGLIQRTGKGRYMRFSSKARAYFKAEFPDLDTEELAKDLLLKLFKKEV